MKSLYDLMLDSEVTDEKGNNYPDPLTIRFKSLQASRKLKDVTITSANKDRLDLLMYDIYGTPNLDDMFLYANGKYKNDLVAGDTLTAYSIDDLNNYYNKNKKDKK